MMVGLDIDGVLADFLPPFLRLVEKQIGNGPIPVESITDFNFKEHPYLTEEAVWKCMEDVSYDPAFWRDLPPLISAQEWRRLEALSDRGKLVFLTHRYEREGYSINQVSSDWLKKHGISRPVIYFTQEPKGDLAKKLGVNLFMDDRYENCADVAAKTGATVLMPHRAYNQSFDHPRVKRIRRFNELFDYLQTDDRSSALGPTFPERGD